MIEELQIGEKRFLLLGTAHISQESITEVIQAIEAHRPDSVCVELCQARFDSIKHPDHWKQMDVVRVVKEGKSGLLMANLVLSSFQKKMGDQLGVKPGAEMVAAVEAAEKIGAQVVLADRSVSVTLKRCWGRLGFFEKAKALAHLFSEGLSAPEITPEEIEALKQTDVLSEAISSLAKELPGVKEVLIDERDQYLAAKIKQAPGATVLAVVGAGHLAGILSWMEKEVDLEPLDQLPPPSRWVNLLKYGFPGLVLALFAYGFTFIDSQTSFEMAKRWFLANGILAGLGAALAGGHILTILVAFLAAPFTSLNPAIAAGWVSGLTEAWVRKPKVADFENLPQDITSLKGFWSNEITRILLVVVFSNLGSSLGSLIGIPLLAALL
ncbi:MAG: conjugal transfer protein TraB [Candidatus Lambdaproteobacteria bacterium RIFOXYD1_FULL_56_27]|uniref:Conjugal transfer protein TraB n=1 Tax=Candidatus Lambdaproteobacteria bacterium RIFOXYD2_FULL_56_26 TaxID=1817773 RepID=A0A1F6GPU4_9PROT|nr:MAG: conjugal transfer protein TraB [Candidatus Lambdaproteobacteria bacterium RIFOXYD2_FULL_56_26]OGH03961.1 MAG: conjugal transfer protein TraB [Candidatus Lambdaproteobacteria bacterium RIFOXYC1_FULL_56_13]OGH06230.1 MAG: conjugal transfer protein TraB [Candidatus Lambdaproteobacteria bacterium RIFOXYD1_FULL_56_27]